MKSSKYITSVALRTANQQTKPNQTKPKIVHHRFSDQMFGVVWSDREDPEITFYLKELCYQTAAAVLSVWGLYSLDGSSLLFIDR